MTQTAPTPADATPAVRRAAAATAAITLVAITVICLAFWVTGSVIPQWFVVAGRWLPAVVAIIVITAQRLPGGVLRWSGIRPRRWSDLIIGCAAAVLVLLVVYGLTAVLTSLVSGAATLPWSQLAMILLMVVPMVLLFSLSTLGEEAVWRGFLQQAYQGPGRVGFWIPSTAIAVIWVLFHIPLHGVMAAQGSLPVTVAVTSTLGLLPLGIFLSACVTRFGCVWPAVAAHALPLTALNLLADPGALPAGTLWLVTAVAAVLQLGAAVAIAPRR